MEALSLAIVCQFHGTDSFSWARSKLSTWNDDKLSTSNANII